MRKHITAAVLASSAALLLSGCCSKPAETSVVTEEWTTTTTAAETTATSVVTSVTPANTTDSTEDQTKTVYYNELSDAAEVISEYDYIKDIYPLLEKNGITDSGYEYIGYMRIGDYVVLEENSPDTEFGSPLWSGLTVLSKTGEYHIDRDDLPASGGLYYYIYDDKLGIYEEYTYNGYHTREIYEVSIKDSNFNRLRWHYGEITDANGEHIRNSGWSSPFSSFTGDHGAYSYIAEKSDGKVYTTAYELSWNGVDCKKPSWEMRIFKEQSENIDPEKYESVFYAAEVPDTAGQSRIFEEGFYGIWENADGSRTVDLTYGDAEFNYDYNPPFALAENDEAYFLFSAPGGECWGLVVRKNEPDKIYISPQFGDDVTENTYYGWYDRSSPAFTRRSDSPEPNFGLGNINIFGQMKVNGMLGEQFAECLKKCMEDNRSFRTNWVLSGGIPSPPEEHILIDLSDSKTVIALKYMYLPDYEEWEKTYDNDIRIMYIAYTFEKDENGGWSMTGSEPYSAVTGCTTGVFAVTDDGDKLKYYEENCQRHWTELKPGDKLNGGRLTVTAASDDIAGPGRFVYCTGEVTLKGIIRRVQETPDFEVETKGDLFFYPLPESLGDLPLILDESQGVAYWRIFEQNDREFYFIADTPSIFLGNNEKKETYTKLPDNRYGHMPPISVEYCDKLDVFTEDFYIAEITFSDLYLIHYPNIMSGSPNSVVNIKSIGEYTPVTFAELAGIYGEQVSASDDMTQE